MEWSISSLRNCENPADLAMDSALPAESPRVPRPAPPGDDIAEDMHDNTLMPYINGAIGFFCAFKENVSWALISTSNHVPFGFSAARMACIISAG